MKSKLMIAAAVAAIAGFSASVHADVIAFTPPVLNSFGSEPAGNDGLFFTPTTAMSVTALGYVFPGSVAGNEVGLYDISTSTLLASANVQNTATQSGYFYYVSIAPVVLTAGDEYAVVGYYTPGNDAVGYTADSGVGTAPDIDFDGYAYDNNSGLDIPTSSYAPPIFGPNFQFTPVPDGGMTVTLLGLAVGACGLFALKMKKRLI